MKKWLLLIVLFLVIQSPANAFIGIDYTGVGAYRDDGGYFPYEPKISTSRLGIFAGRDTGRAAEFEISDLTHIDSLIYDTYNPYGVVPNANNIDGDLHFKFNLYSRGEVFRPSQKPINVLPDVPDVESLVLSSPVHLVIPDIYPYTGGTFSAPFSTDLQPGKYWLAVEAQGGTNVEIRNTKFEGVAAVPEPSTYFLVLMGLVIFCICNGTNLSKSNFLTLNTIEKK